jgi:SLT domain-containing protein
MATGGIVTDAMIAMMGEGRESEAVLPLSRLSALLDRAYEVGANTAPSSASRGGQETTSALNVTLAVDGDGALEELIREHAELVVEERDARKRARIARN